MTEKSEKRISKIQLFKKKDCNVCENFERSIQDRIQRDGGEEAKNIEIEHLYTDDVDGLTAFSDADLGKIPAALFYDENGDEIARWDGRADWDGLTQMLKSE